MYRRTSEGRIGSAERERIDLNVRIPPSSPLSQIYESLFQIKISNPGSPLPASTFFLSSGWTQKDYFQRKWFGERPWFVSFDADNQIKMINRNSMSNWMNMEASVGLNCELFDSNSRLGNRIRDESISEGFRYYPGQYEEQCQPTNPFSIENTINFSDIDKQRFFSTSQRSPSPAKNQTPSPDTDNNRDWAANDSLFRKGLKNLASLLIKTLKKKRYSSHSEVAQEIEKHFMDSELSENTGLSRFQETLVKEQKNIKRRIYDALNVMIAANVLEKELQVIQPRQSSYKNYAVRNICEEHQEEMKRNQLRLDSKRELLFQMQAKRNALKLWMQRKARLREKEGSKKRFQFPLIVLVLEGPQRVCLEECGGKMMIGFQRGEVYSQTDLLSQVYAGQDVKFQQIEIESQQPFFDAITYI